MSVTVLSYVLCQNRIRRVGLVNKKLAILDHTPEEQRLEAACTAIGSTPCPCFEDLQSIKHVLRTTGKRHLTKFVAKKKRVADEKPVARKPAVAKYWQPVRRRDDFFATGPEAAGDFANPPEIVALAAISVLSSIGEPRLWPVRVGLAVNHSAMPGWYFQSPIARPDLLRQDPAMSKVVSYGASYPTSAEKTVASTGSTTLILSTGWYQNVFQQMPATIGDRLIVAAAVHLRKYPAAPFQSFFYTPRLAVKFTQRIHEQAFRLNLMPVLTVPTNPFSLDMLDTLKPQLFFYKNNQLYADLELE